MGNITVKSAIRDYLERHYPGAAFIVRAAQMRRHFRRDFARRQRLLGARIYGGRQPSVLSGPFAGMRYLNEIVWGPIECKWLGSYEQELHPILARILQTDYAVVIDVGSAEGYYSVGLALKLPQAQVHAYDVDPWARRQQLRLARMNAVANLHIHNRCSGAELAARIGGRTLLVCDIEGYEYDLLDPAATPALRACDILVELHGHARRGLDFEAGAKELAGRFAASHGITRIAAMPRAADAVDAGLRGRLTPGELADCLDERRPAGQLWLWLEARPHAADGVAR